MITLVHEPIMPTLSPTTHAWFCSCPVIGLRTDLPAIPRTHLPALGSEVPFRSLSGPRRHPYTNRGLGMMGLPFCFACRPEITLFTLKPAEEIMGCLQIPHFV